MQHIMQYQKFDLSNFLNASLQDLVDQVCEHLIVQDEQSRIPNGSCRYRLESNKDKDKIIACAAGCLISDEQYIENMENNDFVSVLEKSFKSLSKCYTEEQMSDIENYFDDVFTNCHIHKVIVLIQSLQRIHDNFPLSIYFPAKPEIISAGDIRYSYIADSGEKIDYMDVIKDYLIAKHKSWKDALKPFVLSQGLEWRFD